MIKKHIFLLLAILLTTNTSSYTLKRVSVHDPSIVWDPTTQIYYIFGSHRASARSKDLMSWSKVTVPWKTTTSNNAPNSAAFITPQITKVKKGDTEYELNFNAFNWSKKGSVNYSVDDNMWAPDVIWNEKMQKWCMYLSINGDAWFSSIILLTADKITGPYRYQAPVVMSGFKGGSDYKETDLEIAIGTQSSLPARYNTGNSWGTRWPNCIDPCVFYDEEGKLWMSYGSWSGGIWMLELDEDTGLRDYNVSYTQLGSGDGITQDPYFGKKIAGGYYVSGEASYIEYINGYYYLFVTYGGLAAGGNPDDYNNGGYQMRVFRSTKPGGPYTGPNGQSAVFASYLLNFGASANTYRGENIFGAYTDWGNQAKGSDGERSQGHNSIIAAEDGRTYLVYHTRFQDRGEGHQVRVHQVFQNEKGWLVAAPFEYTGEEVKSADIATMQQVSEEAISGTYKLLVHKYLLDHTKKEAVSPVTIQLNQDGTISGSYTGTWQTTEGTSFVTIQLGSSVYYGVMVEQTMEPTNTKVNAFTCMASGGVTIWGYQTKQTTGISNAVADEEKVTAKGCWHALDGRRLEDKPSNKGIYIFNGRKIVEK